MWQTLRFVLVLPLLALLIGCAETDLYTSLSERDAVEMMAILLEHDISCTKREGDEEGLWTLAVSGDRYSDSVALLDQFGYPKEANVDMGQVFEKSGLVSSPSEERIRFQYALSQELSTMISRIPGVLNADVQVVLPERNPFGEEIGASTASVLITHRRGMAVEIEDRLPDIMDLVVSGIEGIDPEGVVVRTFEADELPAWRNESQAEVQTSTLLGVRVVKGYEQRFWTILGGAAAVMVVCLLAIIWLTLRRSGTAEGQA